ncbi:MULTISPECIES: type 1 glutamine amidotransferase domain-containing protein [Polaromonas]|uniref:Type 1 glutamine amidotransferase domain-containing protein n=1 Tax=Polaromonas aquatica TaxID=332657 RepID=A0ABW1TZI8_9BURK
MYVVLTIAVVLVLFLWLGLPALLRAFGLHPAYPGQLYTLPGGRALVITTSHATLGEGGKATGVFGSEMTAPYYAFLDAGMQVDLASIRGGEIPIEPDSFRWFLAAPSDKRYLKDETFQAKVKASSRIDALDFSQYDIIFLAGGWGAAYDLGTSSVLGQKITQAWAAGKVIGGVCHGPLGLLLATETNGEPLVKGKRLTAVTNRQVKQLGITITPQHPERELRAAGALFESASAALEPFANLTVVDGRLVTGQNQNAGVETAQKMLRAAGGKPRP